MKGLMTESEARRLAYIAGSRTAEGQKRVGAAVASLNRKNKREVAKMKAGVVQAQRNIIGNVRAFSSGLGKGFHGHSRDHSINRKKAGKARRR